MGITAVTSVSSAMLPTGFSVIFQLKDNGSGGLFGSDDPLPSNVTLWPTSTVWSGPASAFGISGGSTGAHFGDVHFNTQARPSLTVITPSPFVSLGSPGSTTNPRASKIIFTSSRSTSLSPSISQAN